MAHARVPFLYAFRLRSLAIMMLSTAGALALRLLLDPWLHDQMPYTPFIVAVAITGLYAGVSASLVSVVLGFVLGNYFFVQPRLELVAFASQQDWAASITYLLASAVIVVLTGARTAVLMRSQELLQEIHAIVDASPLGIISLSLERTVRTWNNAAQQILGWSAAEIVGAMVRLPPSMAQQWTELTERIKAGETFVNIESKLLRKDGAEIDALISGSPIRDSSGVIDGFIGMVADATDINRAKNALIEAEKLAAAGRLASTIAHEVNNPLEGAINLIFLARSEDNREQIQKYLQSAEHELSRASAMVRKTLAFLHESLSPEVVRVEQTLDQVLSLYERPLADRNIRITRKLHDGCALITYPQELQRIIINLITNAMDAMLQGGVLTVSARPTRHPISGRGGVRVTIADNGIGIPADSRYKIFEPFFTTKPATGTGLGLWVTKSIIGRIGGHIRMRSIATEKRHGTVFSVFLPSTTAVPSIQTQASAAGAVTHAQN